jgi:hypothetical protein
MSSKSNAAASISSPARRQVLAGAVACGGIVIGARHVAAETADSTRTSLHQEIEFAVSPQRI